MHLLLRDFEVRNAFEICFHNTETKYNSLSIVSTNEKFLEENYK
jgi:hypothetical protein